MTNNDREYVRDLERALASAENEIKALEREISNQSRIMDDMQEQINSPLHMGELPRHLLSDDFLRQRDVKTLREAANNLDAWGGICENPARGFLMKLADQMEN